jgi:hypothetical protein
MTYKMGRGTDEVLCGFERGGTSLLKKPAEKGILTKAELLLSFSRKSLMFPKVRSKEQLDILSKITEYTSLEEAWSLSTYRELDQTNDADRFFDKDGDCRYRLYGGKNIFQFSYSPPYAQEVEYYSVPEDENPDKSAKRRIREKNKRLLKNQIYRSIDAPSSKSKKGAVNDHLTDLRGRELSEQDVLLDCTEYRIA